MATTVSTAQPVSTETFGTTSPVTGSAPTVATDGLPTWGLAQVTVTLSAPSGQTLSGAGSVKFYEFNAWLGRWAYVPGLDVSVTASGVRDVEVATIQIAQFHTKPGLSGSNRIQAVPTGITFSGGSTGIQVTMAGTYNIMAGQ